MRPVYFNKLKKKYRLLKKVLYFHKKNLQIVHRKNKLMCGKKEDGIYEE